MNKMQTEFPRREKHRGRLTEALQVYPKMLWNVLLNVFLVLCSSCSILVDLLRNFSSIINDEINVLGHVLRNYFFIGELYATVAFLTGVFIAKTILWSEVLFS